MSSRSRVRYTFKRPSSSCEIPALRSSNSTMARVPGHSSAQSWLFCIASGIKRVLMLIGTLLFCWLLCCRLCRSDRLHRSLPGCGTHSECHAVLASRWSRWGPIPVTGTGVVLYTVAVGAAICFQVRHGQIAAQLLGGSIVTATVAALWFLALQAWVIRKFCRQCVLIHLGALMSCLIWIVAWQGPATLHPWTGVTAGAVSLGWIVGQALLKPKLVAIDVVASHSSDDLRPLPNIELAASDPRPPVATVFLNGGSVELNPADWPVLGSPLSGKFVAWLFDYTCDECHQAHRLLRDAVDLFEGRLAVLMIPTPMHPACNPTASCRDGSRADGCGWARLCHQVWQTDPQRFAEWDRRISELPAGTTLVKGIGLTRTIIPAALSPDARPLIEQRLADAIRVFHQGRANTLPALLLPGGVLRGRVASAAELRSMIRKHL